MRRKPGGRFRRGRMSGVHGVHKFTEVIKIADLVSVAGAGGGAVGNGYNLAFTGNTIQNLSGSLVDVFKQFTVTGIKLMYLPAYNTYPLVAGTAIIPKMYYAEDKASFTPDNLAGNVNRMLQQDNVKILDSSKRFTHWISKPRAYLQQLPNGVGYAGTTPVAPPAKQIQWLTTDELAGPGSSGMAVDWIHSQLVVEPNNSAVNITTGAIWARVFYSCKDQR